MPSLTNSWNERDRQRFADRDVLRAQTVPPADRPVPQADEWDDLGWEFLDEELTVDEAQACSLENPESCESCQ